LVELHVAMQAPFARALACGDDTPFVATDPSITALDFDMVRTVAEAARILFDRDACTSPCEESMLSRAAAALTGRNGMRIVCGFVLMTGIALGAEEPCGRFADRTALWEQAGGDLLRNFCNMYNLDIVATPEDADYPYKSWFFGWSVEDTNPKFSGCDAIFMARGKTLTGAWEVFSGEEDGKPVWDATMNPERWMPVITAQDKFYDNWHNGDPSVVRIGDTYYMAYSSTGHNRDGIPYHEQGDTDSDISCVMGATSKDGIHWTRTAAPILIEPSNIGGKPVEPGAYGHPTGNYHRPSLMHENGIFKIWFDCIVLGKPMMTLYAENRGEFTNPEDWKILRGMDNPCINDYPNPEVVKVGDLYYAYGDPGSYGKGWVGRKICEAASVNGMDWVLLGYSEPDADAQAHHVPEAFVREEDGKTYVYVNYGTQKFNDYRYDRIRMKRREITPEERARVREACKAAMAVATTAGGDEEQAPADALLPQELAPDVHVLCASHRFGSATVGWVTFPGESILIDCPHPDYLPKILAGIASTTGLPVKRVILTHSRPSQLEAAQVLLQRGIEVYAASQTALLLERAVPSDDRAARVIRQVGQLTLIRDNGGWLELHPLGHAAGPGNLAVFVRHRNILFTGEVCSNGPKNDLARGHNRRWIAALGQLEQLSAATVVPALGGAGGPELLRRQKDFLVELRRRVSYLVTQSKPREFVVDRLKLHSGEPVSPLLANWFPYDTPEVTDIEHLYDELTVPLSPYTDDPFAEEDTRPRALALIGDRVHDPAHIEACLTRAFSEAGVAVRFAFDVRALTAENLEQVQLFCILRDGVHWPAGSDTHSVWMTSNQEEALVDFVDRGGALFGLHNCPGLYPEGGPYLELLGGTYNGHGPLERFRVAVHDTDHPIARGVESFEVADEQHTPVPNLDKVHVFLKSYSDEGVEAAAGWTREFGKGRVCYLANGHTRESLAHPTVQLLVRNAIDWCLKREPGKAGQ
jgi:type 1 glutamine amidotransferase